MKIRYNFGVPGDCTKRVILRRFQRSSPLAGLPKDLFKHSKILRSAQNDAKESGFTLIEMLLAVTLFAIVMSSGFGVFRMGIHIWQRIQGHSAVERKALLVLEKMGRDIRTAVRISGVNESFAKQKVEYKGSRSEISFPAIVTKAGKKQAMVTQTGRITYRLESSGVLCKKIENATDFYLKKEAACEPLLRNIQSGKFQYWNYDRIGKEYAWYDEWSSDSAPLPKAVSLSLVLKSAGKGLQGASKKEYHQTWILPVGGEVS